MSGIVHLYLFAKPPLPFPRWLSRDHSVSRHSGALIPCDGNFVHFARVPLTLPNGHVIFCKKNENN